MKKRVWSFLLAAVMVAGILPAAYAAENDDVLGDDILPGAGAAVYVNGVPLTDGVYWKNGDTEQATGTSKDYNAYYQDGVLTLNKADITKGYNRETDQEFNGGPCGIYAEDALTLKLTGTSTITMSNPYSLAVHTNKDLTVEGTGKLNIKDRNTDHTKAACYGLTSSGKLLVKSGNVSYKGTATGFFALGTITISGGTHSLTGMDSGMYSPELITISGGTVKAVGMSGINGEALTVSKNATVIAKADGTHNSCAIRNTKVTVSDNLPIYVGSTAADAKTAPKAFYSDTTKYTYAVVGTAFKDLAKSTVTLSYKNCTDNGKARKPAVTVKVGAKTLKEGTDYRLVYSKNNKVGTATVTVKALSNSTYIGSISKTFKINPKGTKVANLKNNSKGKVKVQWAKNGTATGYQVQFSRTSTFKTAETIKLHSGKETGTTISNLTKNRTYYVRMRTCQTVGKTTYYSAWSDAKSVKITK